MLAPVADLFWWSNLWSQNLFQFGPWWCFLECHIPQKTATTQVQPPSIRKLCASDFLGHWIQQNAADCMARCHLLQFFMWHGGHATNTSWHWDEACEKSEWWVPRNVTYLILYYIISYYIVLYCIILYVCMYVYIYVCVHVNMIVDITVTHPKYGRRRGVQSHFPTILFGNPGASCRWPGVRTWNRGNRKCWGPSTVFLRKETLTYWNGVLTRMQS